MELTLLTVPACPHAAAFEERLAAVLADHPGVVVHRREVSGERAADETGMHGSPTLLIDGVDPFAVAGQPPSLSCRLYRGRGGTPRAGAISGGVAAGASGRGRSRNARHQAADGQVPPMAGG